MLEDDVAAAAAAAGFPCSGLMMMGIVEADDEAVAVSVLSFPACCRSCCLTVDKVDDVAGFLSSGSSLAPSFSGEESWKVN